MSKIIYQGNYKGLESYTEEYKVFCLDGLEQYFSNEEIKNFLLCGIRLNYSKFNSMVRTNLYNSMNKYLPKYIGNFSKAGISGKFYIGITDNGIIEGIPWYGKLTKKIIKRIINNVFDTGNSRGVKYDNLTKSISYDDEIVNWYFSNLEINIYNLGIDHTKTEEQYIRSIKKLQLLIMKNKHIEKEWLKYEIEYDKWWKRSSVYSGKLNNYILNDKLFAEVIKYIHEQIKDEPTLKSILEYYKNKSNFDEFVLNNNKKIKSVYDDPTNPVIWIVRYKDSMCCMFKGLKPKKPPKKPIHNILNIYANHISNIKAHLLKISKIQFYLIEIYIKYLIDTHTEYRKSIFSEWLSKSRIVIKGSPSCI